jgi:hypothetical protein
MPSKKLRRTFEKVRILSLATPLARKQLIQKGGKETIKCIAECCHNILEGNVKLDAKQKNCLAKHKSKLRSLADKKLGLQKKQKIIQTGKFPLAAILVPAAAALSAMLFR